MLCSTDIFSSTLNKSINSLTLNIYVYLLLWIKPDSVSQPTAEGQSKYFSKESGKLSQSEPKTAQYQIFVWVWFLTDFLSAVGLLWAMCHHSWLILYLHINKAVHTPAIVMHTMSRMIMWAFPKPMNNRSSLSTKRAESHMLSQDCVQQIWQMMLQWTIAFVYIHNLIWFPFKSVINSRGVYRGLACEL